MLSIKLDGVDAADYLNRVQSLHNLQSLIARLEAQRKIIALAASLLNSLAPSKTKGV